MRFRRVAAFHAGRAEEALRELEAAAELPHTSREAGRLLDRVRRAVLRLELAYRREAEEGPAAPENGATPPP